MLYFDRLNIQTHKNSEVKYSLITQNVVFDDFLIRRDEKKYPKNCKFLKHKLEPICIFILMLQQKLFSPQAARIAG
jgi:hypothetical protein